MLENCWREHISGSLEKFFEIYYVSILNYLFFFIYMYYRFFYIIHSE